MDAWRARCPRRTASVVAAPYAFWDDVAALVARAARLAGDPKAAWPVRGRAASLCKVLAYQVAADEALCAACVRAASACVETFPVAQDLLVAARELAPDESRLVAPLLRLCAGAHAGGHHATVVVALFELAEIVAFDGNVPGAWLAGTTGLEHEAAYWLRHLVRRWVLRFGGANEGVRTVIRERQDELFLERRMPAREVLRLHAVEPTAAGWSALARRRQELMPGPLPLSFGDRADDAVSTLREALARPHSAGEDIALKRWLLDAPT